MRIKPLHDRIVVQRIDSDSMSAGGIHIPDNAKERPVQGVIVAVGAGKRSKAGDLVPLDLHVGDRVLFTKFCGTSVKLDGDDYMIMGEDDVLATLDGDGTIDASEQLGID